MYDVEIDQLLCSRLVVEVRGHYLYDVHGRAPKLADKLTQAYTMKVLTLTDDKMIVIFHVSEKDDEVVLLALGELHYVTNKFEILKCDL